MFPSVVALQESSLAEEPWEVWLLEVYAVFESLSKDFFNRQVLVDQRCHPQVYSVLVSTYGHNLKHNPPVPALLHLVDQPQSAIPHT